MFPFLVFGPGRSFLRGPARLLFEGFTCPAGLVEAGLWRAWRCPGKSLRRLRASRAKVFLAFSSRKLGRARTRFFCFGRRPARPEFLIRFLAGDRRGNGLAKFHQNSACNVGDRLVQDLAGDSSGLAEPRILRLPRSRQAEADRRSPWITVGSGSEGSGGQAGVGLAVCRNFVGRTYTFAMAIAPAIRPGRSAEFR